MPDKQEIVREFVICSRKVIELGELTNEDNEAIRYAMERLLASIAQCQEE